MSRHLITVLAGALLFLAPAASRANLSAYSQNFEGLVMADPAALQNDGWLVYGNVFTPAHVYMYGYGSFPAPNGGNAFSSIDAGQGGPEQGAQQLSIYSDYNNGDHANGNWIESNVFHEQSIGSADVGSTWTFQFDAKLGLLVSPSTAIAFIKTLNPSAGYATTNFLPLDMTALPTTWGTFQISIPIDGSLVGQLMQFGFASTATSYVASGVFYDNVTWLMTGSTGVGSTLPSNGIQLGAASPNPFSHSTRIEFSLAQRGTAEVCIYDIAGRRVATLFNGLAEPGPHMTTWDGHFSDGRVAPAGVYQCVLQTAAGRQARNMVLSR